MAMKGLKVKSFSKQDSQLWRGDPSLTSLQPVACGQQALVCKILLSGCFRKHPIRIRSSLDLPAGKGPDTMNLAPLGEPPLTCGESARRCQNPASGQVEAR